MNIYIYIKGYDPSCFIHFRGRGGGARNTATAAAEKIPGFNLSFVMERGKYPRSRKILLSGETAAAAFVLEGNR